jgi:hypothetical protein
MKQPKALRLSGMAWIARGKDWHVEADAELRRLHEVNQELLDALKEAEPMLAAMFNHIVTNLGGNYTMTALDRVRAVITKAGGAA